MEAGDGANKSRSNKQRGEPRMEQRYRNRGGDSRNSFIGRRACRGKSNGRVVRREKRCQAFSGLEMVSVMELSRWGESPFPVDY
ncbi:hypothetical protein TB2_013163 [Malus domestica]